MDTIRYKLTIAYDGTRYAGWQCQKSGAAVQELIEQSLAALFHQPLRLHSSSRTDAGVHARALVAHVDLPRAGARIPARKLPLAINARLPEDIRVVGAVQVRPEFHARFAAAGKEYRYFVWNHAVMDPLHRHHAWHVPAPLDLDAMRRAAAGLVGRHDFRSFAANRTYRTENTVRTLSHCSLRRAGPLLTFRIRGDGFLYKMCRSIVGTLVQVGQRRIPASAIPEILAHRDRRVAGLSAPAHGLVLWQVFYS